MKNMHYLAITLTIGIIMFAGSAASVSAAPLSSSSSTPNWESVVTKANPYVTVNNNIATIDPQISQHLSADEVALVKQYVNRYNSLPLSTRQHPHQSGTSYPQGVQPDTVTGGFDAFQWTIDTYWWGIRIWINTYGAQHLGILGGAAGAVLGASAGNILGAASGAIIGGILGTIAGSVTALFDDQCGGKGVFIDINFRFA